MFMDVDSLGFEKWRNHLYVKFGNYIYTILYQILVLNFF